jgi:hypothetical protein
MLPKRKRRGFSGDARPSGPRYRLTGLPGPTLRLLLPHPQYGQCRVCIAV